MYYFNLILLVLCLQPISVQLCILESPISEIFDEQNWEQGKLDIIKDCIGSNEGTGDEGGTDIDGNSLPAPVALWPQPPNLNFCQPSGTSCNSASVSTRYFWDGSSCYADRKCNFDGYDSESDCLEACKNK